MAAKTTSGSGFHFIFVLYALDLVENAYNIERSPRHLLDIWRQSLQNLKIMQLSYMKSGIQIFMTICGHCGPIPQCQILFSTHYFSSCTLSLSVSSSLPFPWTVTNMQMTLSCSFLSTHSIFTSVFHFSPSRRSPTDLFLDDC